MGRKIAATKPQARNTIPQYSPPREFKKHDAKKVQMHGFSAFCAISFWINLRALRDRQFYSVTDPGLNNVVLMVVFGIYIVLMQYGSELIFGTFCAMLAPFLAIYGCIPHVFPSVIYHYVVDPGYHSSMWVLELLCNSFGVAMLILAAKRVHSINQRGLELYIKAVGSFIVVVGAIVAAISGFGDGRCGDGAFFEAPTTPTPGPLQHLSQYVTIGNVRLAVDVYLPHNYDLSGRVSGIDISPPHKLPTILHLTHYSRSTSISYPANRFRILGENRRERLSTQAGQLIQTLVPAGYAFVSVDARGTGASYGIRALQYAGTEQERDDHKNIIEWVRAQTWADGDRLGAYGVGTDASAALRLTADIESVTAVALVSPPGNCGAGVSDIDCIGFKKSLAAAAAAAELFQTRLPGISQLPLFDWLWHEIVLGGPASVGPCTGGASNKIKFESGSFIEAQREHEGNDADANPGSGAALALVVEKLAAKKVEVYGLAGYDDVQAADALGKLCQELSWQRCKVTIGPWTAGLRSCRTGSAPEGSAPEYPVAADLKRFFDCKLLGDCVMLPANEAMAHFFDSGSGAWTAVEAWPPHKHSWHELHLGAEGSLVTASDAISATFMLPVNPKATSGKRSRWNVVWAALGQPVFPLTNNGASAFVTPRLSSLLVMVGKIQLILSMELEGTNSTSTAVFVYVDDVSEDGTTFRVTDGHGLTSADAGRVQAKIELEPVGHTFLAGHSVRVTLAGVDVDNFEGPKPATEWKIFTPDSFVRIPVLGSDR